MAQLARQREREELGAQLVQALEIPPPSELAAVAAPSVVAMWRPMAARTSEAEPWGAAEPAAEPEAVRLDVAARMEELRDAERLAASGPQELVAWRARATLSRRAWAAGRKAVASPTFAVARRPFPQPALAAAAEAERTAPEPALVSPVESRAAEQIAPPELAGGVALRRVPQGTRVAELRASRSVAAARE